MSKGKIIEQQTAQINQLTEQRNQLTEQRDQLKFELDQLKKIIFGSRSEKSTPVEVAANQLSLFEEIIEAPEDNSSDVTHVREHMKKVSKHPGRHSLPDHLPVEEIVLEPEEDTTGLKKIGVTITETLEYIPASLFRKRYIRPKYAKPNGDGVIIADLPDRAIPKGLPEAGLLSHLITSKFVEHQPFYRQIEKFKRDYKIDLPSSTLNDWFAATCTLLKPLYERLKQTTFDTDYLQVDESPIKVLDKDKKGKTHQGYQWVYSNPLNRQVIFDYRKGRGMHGPKEMLLNYQGILQCDGYTVYDKIGKSEHITLAGCLAHVRRKYVEAKENDPTRASKAIGIFANIYRLEKLAKQSDHRKTYREQHIKPLLLELKNWIDEECIKVLPKSAIGKAMRYTVNQWHKIMAIMTDGRIELDNNWIENKIRPLALGRKNYLFAGSHSGAQRIAIMYSFFATCKANDVNPFQWLKSTLEKIPTHNIRNIDELLPSNYSEDDL